MTHPSSFFAQPDYPPMRRYEALRAHLHEGIPMQEAAARFGYTYGSFRNLLARFRKNPSATFFWPLKPQVPQPTEVPVDRRRERIVALRKQQGASLYQIQQQLAQEGIPVSTGYIQGVFKQEGIQRLARRPPHLRSVRALQAVTADRRQLDLSPRSFRTDFGGLFLLAFDLARMNLDSMLEEVGMPGTKMIPAGCAVRSLLALKLSGVGRPSQVMAETLDEGLGLFAGLNVIPKRSKLTEYSVQADPRFALPLMDQWYHAAVALEPALHKGHSFDLDFHTIPYHGDQALMQDHFVSKRSRRQRGVLAFLARDADARVLAYADTTVRKQNQNDAILRFVDHWKKRTGSLPGELVFDSRLTIYRNLDRLSAMKINFITLRRRYPKLKERIRALPNDEWRRITLHNKGRKYRHPRIVDELTTLRTYSQPIRQILVKGLGHDPPTVMITNQLERSAPQLVDRYARRMIVENVISDTIDFFHLDALSSAVPLKINVDTQLTLMAAMLLRMLALRVGHGFETAESRTIYRKLIRHSGTVTLSDRDIIVQLKPRANLPYLLNADYHNRRQPIPWLGNKTLQVQFT